MGSFSDKIKDLFQSIFSWMWDWIVGPFGDLKSFEDLIFGKSGDTNLVYGIFTPDQITNIIKPGMTAFQAIGMCVILISIILSGIKISSSGINPSNRNYVIEFFKDLAIVTIVFFNLTTFYDMVFQFNHVIVSDFGSGAASKQLIKIKENIDSGPGVIGNLIINLCLLGLSIWANFYYMMRTLTLTLLMIMGPFVLSLYLIPQTKGIVGGYFKEFTGTVFVQAVHAAVYWVISLLSASTSGIEGIILYIIFIPVTESIRSLFGLGGQMNDRLSRTAAMFGGSALLGVGGAIKGALNGQSVAHSLRNLAGQAVNHMKKGKGEEGEEGSKSLLANTGNTSSTSKAERMLKAGEISSKMGKAVFGAAGAIAGSPMGPMGSISMSTLGFSTGGAVGGLAGRVGWATGETAFNRTKAGIKGGLDKGKGVWNAEAKADEKLANKMANQDTQKWAGENKESFMKDLKERFPDAYDSELNGMWDKEVAGKNNEYLNKARNTIGQFKKGNGQHAKAHELVNSSVQSLSNDWINNNKEQFNKDYDSSKPLPENATEGQILKHNQTKEKAWQTAVNNKRGAIQAVAESTASKLSKGVPLSGAYINKGDFAKELSKELTNENPTGALVHHAASSLTNDWAKNNKQQFMKNYDDQNPMPANATPEVMRNHQGTKNKAWNNELSKKRDSISQILNTTASNLDGKTPIDQTLTTGVANEIGQVLGISAKDGQMNKIASQIGNVLQHSQKPSPIMANLNGANLAKNQQIGSTTVDNIVKDWSTANKQTFMNDYDTKNPVPMNTTQSEINSHQSAKQQAWNSAVSNKRQAITKTIQGAQNRISNGNNEVVQELGNTLGIPKGDSKISALSSQVSTAFQNTSAINEVGQKSVLQAINNATGNIKGATLYSGKSVNSPYLINQLAGIKANEGKEPFIASQIQQHGISEADAKQKWIQQEPQRVQEQIRQLSQNPSLSHIPLDHSIVKNKGIIRGVSAVASGLWAGGVSASGTKEIATFLSDTKIGQGIQVGAATLVNGLSKENMQLGVVSGVGTAVKTAISQGYNTGKTHVASNVIGKQVGFRNAVAYTFGTVGGVNGYRKGAVFADAGVKNIGIANGKGLQWNPYNNAVNNQTFEVSDIAQMAQTTDDDFGGSAIADGAIKLVTTQNQSYIQVKGKTGQVKNVSRINTGDANLQKGQTVYQDLTIQNGNLSVQSTPYQFDSGGGKVQLNRRINVDPNKLVANRNTPKTNTVVTEVQAYNQLIDSGQFMMDDIASSDMQDIKMVINRDKSYMVGTKQGKEYRISPYGNGDARLNTEQTVYTNCEVRNRKIVSNNVYKTNINDELKVESNFTTSLSPSSLIPKQENPRNRNRKQLDRARNQSFTEPFTLGGK